MRRPRENDVAARRARRRARRARRPHGATSSRTSDGDGAAALARPRRQGRARVATGIGFLDHLLTLCAFHAGFDLELLAAGDLDVDEHHTVEDVLAALGDALAQALGSRDGVARYGSATVPMDEASATAAVDLVRRPHAEIALAFSGDRVGGLAPTLAAARARAASRCEGGFTLHVAASGADDHHVAEAAFKALGRALGEACAPGGGGVRSTKGLA